MQEFMLLVQTEGDHMIDLSPEEQQNHVQKVGAYIQNLMTEGKLKGAQPLEVEGAVVSGNKGTFHDGPYTETKEVIVGYFHIVAENLEEATAIAKANPVFEQTKASIFIRPIKSMDGIN